MIPARASSATISGIRLMSAAILPQRTALVLPLPSLLLQENMACTEPPNTTVLSFFHRFLLYLGVFRQLTFPVPRVFLKSPWQIPLHTT